MRVEKQLKMTLACIHFSTFVFLQYNQLTRDLSLNLKGLRPFFCCVHQWNKNKNKLENICRIFYFTCLRSCGKNFMKFDHRDWKIISIQSWKIKFFWTLACNFRWLWPPFVELFCTKVGDSKSNLLLKATSNTEVHFTFFNVPTMYILGGGCF